MSAPPFCLSSSFSQCQQLPQKPATKKSKSPKRNRGKRRETEDVEPTLDVIPGIDESLLKVLETNADATVELSEEALNQFAPIENFEDVELLALPEERRTGKVIETKTLRLWNWKRHNF